VKLPIFADKYKEFLDNYGPAKLQRRKCELFIFTISAATIAFPIMYGFLLFQPVLPENRFLTEIFELDVKMEMKMLPMILMLALDYGIIEGVESIYMVDVPCLIYYECCVYWNKLLEPVSLEIQNGEANFTCKIGCVLTHEEIIKFYQEQAALERLFNDIYGHRVITLNSASILCLWTTALYVCIRHSKYLLQPGYQIAPFGVIMTTIVEYFITLYVVEAYESSSTFLKSVKTAIENEKRKKRCAMLKFTNHFRPLVTQLAYPYFVWSRENFLAFFNQGIDFLVNLLVSIH